MENTEARGVVFTARRYALPITNRLSIDLNRRSFPWNANTISSVSQLRALNLSISRLNHVLFSFVLVYLRELRYILRCSRLKTLKQ